MSTSKQKFEKALPSLSREEKLDALLECKNERLKDINQASYYLMDMITDLEDHIDSTESPDSELHILIGLILKEAVKLNSTARRTLAFDKHWDI